VDENLITRGLIRDGHDPVATTTILTHDTVDEASIHPALRVDHASILTSDHGREDSIEAVLSVSVSGAKHFSILSEIVSVIGLTASILDGQHQVAVHFLFHLDIDHGIHKKVSLQQRAEVMILIPLVVLTVECRNNPKVFHDSLSLVLDRL
jgi:hypothetical protein